jgi:hypothetical protein
MKSFIFWDITPCSPLIRRFGGPLTTFFHAGFLLGLFFNLFEMIIPSETSDDFQRTTRRFIPEDITRVVVSFL